MVLRFLLFFFSALFAWGDLPPLPKEVETAVASARALPPELFADTALRLIESGRIANVAWQKALLNDAFSAAQQAHEPYRWLALPGLSEDTRESYRAKAGELQMDALSLQSSILRLLVTVDRTRARELFGRIPRPQLDAGTCEDALLADPSAYYESAALMAQATFSGEEKKQSLHAQFLVGVLNGVSSTTELAGFVQALEAVELSSSEMQILAGAIEAKLNALPPGYRSFGMKVEQLASALDFFAARAKSMGLATDTLGISFRRYLVNQMTGPRCKEDSGRAAQFLAAMPVKHLGVIPPLTLEEMKPSKRGGELKTNNYFDSDRTQEVAQALNRLIFTPGGPPFSATQRASSAWSTLFDDFLREYQAWNPSGSDTDVLHQRLTVLRKLMEITPAGEVRQRVYTLCRNTLKAANPRERPAEWEWESRVLDAAFGP